jgi:hypothetical protein
LRVGGQIKLIAVAHRALNAERFSDPAEMANQPSEQVQIDGLALAHSGFELFELDFEARGALAKSKLKLRHHVGPAQIADMQIHQIFPTPDPRASAIAAADNECLETIRDLAAKLARLGFNRRMIYGHIHPFLTLAHSRF